MDAFDIVIVGGGSAGISAAMRGADQGARVCLIEQERIGGACFRKGLYPYKAAMTALNNNSSDVTVNGIIDDKKLAHYVKRVTFGGTRGWGHTQGDKGVGSRS